MNLFTLNPYIPLPHKASCGYVFESDGSRAMFEASSNIPANRRYKDMPKGRQKDRGAKVIDLKERKQY